METSDGALMIHNMKSHSDAADASLISSETMIKIRGLPGNNQCCDCGSFHDIQWSSVKLGVLLCLECAGRHRSLGVQVSTVKSLHMDAWEPMQVLYLLESGNARFKETIKKIDSNLDWNLLQLSDRNCVPEIYQSASVRAYQDNLHKRVRHLFGEDNSMLQSSSDSPEALSVWPWQCPEAHSQISVPSLQRDRSTCNNFNAEHLHNYTKEVITLSDSGPLGMTISKESHSGRAFVSKLIRGGMAHITGIRVRDFIDEVNFTPTKTYQEVMQCVMHASRPLTLTLLREYHSTSEYNEETEEHSKNDEDLDDTINSSEDFSLFHQIEAVVNATSRIASPACDRNPLISNDFRVTFPSGPLGLTVVRDSSLNDGINSSELIAPVVVSKVEEGGQAQRFGIILGDCVIGINEEWVTGLDDFKAKASSLEFPLTLIFRRRNICD